ncbi:MAG: Gfo/Idh/MocA family oxidoreductase [Blastochloris sp.]|nr:Gfo/Idh/MocA family oxidoreductase [Blastochloris sp.]
MRKVRWGLLATGAIANSFAKGVLHSEYGELQAVASRQQSTADAFAHTYTIPKAYGTYEALLQDPNVDAVYISTPHPQHVQWIELAARAGKHILCEKPLTMNYEQALRAAACARTHDVLLMEAFMVRCHPLIDELRKLITEKALGHVRLIKATFSFHCDYDPSSRLLNKSLGGGGILDVGCYTTSLARLIAGLAIGQPFSDPLQVLGAAGLIETGVDGWAAATLKFPGNILAQVNCGCQLHQENGLYVYGSAGRLRIPNCWVPAIEGGAHSIFIEHNGLPEKEIIIQTNRWLYSLEVDAFARALHAGLRSVPEVPIEDTLGNVKTLELWLQQAGVSYAD